MKITLGTDVIQRDEFAAFLNHCGIETELGSDSNDYIDGIRVRPYEDGRGANCQNLEWDIFQSRWRDFLTGKLNSLPDGVVYVNHTYRAHFGFTRFHTKPLVCISFDTTGSDVILGRTESVPHANPPTAGFADALIAAVEKVHPSIQACIRYRPHSPFITMSRTAEKASGITAAEMARSVRAIIDTIEQ